EDRDGVAADGARTRLVIARDSGETTLWPGLPVGEVIRRYEEEYGAVEEPAPAAGTPPRRLDLEATSFLLSPPPWLREGAEAMGIPGGKKGEGGTPSGAPEGAAASDKPGAPGVPAQTDGAPAWPGADVSAADGGEDASVGLPATVLAPALSGSDADDAP